MNVLDLMMTAKSSPANDTTSFQPDYYVYTDGSCSNNGGVHALAGMGVYFGKDDPRNMSQRVKGKQSNNTGELGAILLAYTIIEKDVRSGKKVMIASDSIYAIRAATTYGASCAASGWNKDIPNKELVRKAYDIFKNEPNIRFLHVKGHTEGTDIHSIGNDGADKLANKAIGLEACPYAQPPAKLYLNVPYAKKDEAKAMGACWDAGKKKWWIMDSNKYKAVLLERFGLKS
jgi:ribonuclease HI